MMRRLCVTLALALCCLTAQQAGAAYATGGTVTNYFEGGTNWTAHIFTNAGTFLPVQAGRAEVLVVAGGGGGARSTSSGSGGGGAGGLVYTNLVIQRGYPYAILVGAGGMGRAGSSGIGTNGGSSAFGPLVAYGGGGGGTAAVGANGGSGGGGGGTNTGGAGVSGQGFAGGSGIASYAGGGGGAASIGLSGAGTLGGNGGTGKTYSISGILTGYAGGGGGAGAGSDTNCGVAVAGFGGGDGKYSAAGGSGGAGTGGGGGGGVNGNDGGNGGSGVVIVRYPTVKNVILISIDGWGSAYATGYMAGTGGVYECSNLAWLKNNGASTFNARNDPDMCVTLPEHVGMLTARGALNDYGHGWTKNSDPVGGETIHSVKSNYVYSIFNVTATNGLRSGVWATKSKFSLFIDSYPSQISANYVQDVDPDVVVAAFTNMLATNATHFSFVHFRDGDDVGHASGWGSTQFLAAIKNIDTAIGSIIQAVTSSPALRTNTVVIVTADHGGHGTTHTLASTNALDFTIPVIVWGSGVDTNVDLYAVNPSYRSAPAATEKPYYTNAVQPIRNEDLVNLAASLMGLPAVSGSVANADQSLVVQNVSQGTNPVFVVSPLSQSANVGATLNLFCLVSGSSVAYQWQANGATIVGATATNYSKTVTAEDSGKLFTVVAANLYGAATSGVATLTVTGQDVIGGTSTNYTLNGTNWTAHIFTNAGTLTVNSEKAAEVLVVAGGGGGASTSSGGGGGGAGGAIYTNLTLAVTNYSIVIGAGGLGFVGSGSGASGSNSAFGSLVAFGGGYGGGNAAVGGNGGSGGGGGGGNPVIGLAGTGTVSQGNNGGQGSTSQNGGGGGGKSDVGSNGTTTNGGHGGHGLSYDLSGVATYYAGGGGAGGGTVGGAFASGLGGLGGGGPGTNANAKATSGMANTGGGGGGCKGSTTGREGGNGGSGIVIVRYVAGAADAAAPARSFYRPNLIMRRNMAVKNQESGGR
jgi:hypothetical protein